MMFDLGYCERASGCTNTSAGPNRNGSGKDHVMANATNAPSGAKSQTKDVYASRRKWENPSTTRTYYAWRSMRNRCTNPKNASWKHYGGRGVSVCDRWLTDYDAFVEDMGIAPDGLTLDRIETNGNYEPSNCRWTGWVAQANNKRSNVNLTHDGKTQTSAQWADELGIGRDTLHRRLSVYGMDVAKALTPGSLVPETRCGTSHGYVKGCRCDDCRAAHAKAYRDGRKKHAKRLADEIPSKVQACAVASIGNTPRAYWPHAKKWVGFLIADDLGFCLKSKQHRRALMIFVDNMLSSGELIEVQVPDKNDRLFRCVIASGEIATGGGE